MTNKGLTILAIATVVAVTAAVFVQQSDNEPATEGGRYFEDLLSNVNRVEKILVKSKDYEVTIVRSNGPWVVSEKNNYPAADEKVRGMILGLARLEKIEAKTRNPELYKELGVQGNGDPAAGTMLVQLLNNENIELATTIIGNRKGSVASSGASQFYVRKPADPQAWLVEGKLPRVDWLRDWLDTEIKSVAEQRVRGVTVHHDDGQMLTVSKAKPGEKNFQIERLAPGEQVEAIFSINRIVNSFVTLSAVDVFPAAEYASRAETSKSTTIEVTTFDGLRLTLVANREGEAVYARLEAGFDEALVWAGNDAAAATDDDARGDPKQKAMEGTTGTSVTGQEEQGVTLKSIEQARLEAIELNKRWKPWVYQIPSYSFENLAVKKSDLLKKTGSGEETETGVGPAIGK